MNLKILRNQQGWDDSCYVELLEKFIASRNLTSELTAYLLFNSKSDIELTQEVESVFDAPIKVRIPARKITTSIREPITFEE